MKQLTLLILVFFSYLNLSAQNGLVEIPLAELDSLELSYAHNYVTHLTTDGNDVFLAFMNGGVNSWDGNSWTKYTTFNSGLPSDHATHISFADANMYVSTLNGVGVFDGNSWSVIDSLSGLPNDTVLAFLSVNGKQYFVSTEYLFVNDGSGFQQFKFDEHDADGSPQYNSSRIIVKDNWDLIISRRYEGAYVFNGDSLSRFIEETKVKLMLEDDKLWVAGSELYTLQNGIRTNFTDNYNDGFLEEASYRGFKSILRGSNGHLFFSAGRNMFEAFEDQIRSYRMNIFSNNPEREIIELNNEFYALRANSAQALYKLDINVYNDFEQQMEYHVNGNNYNNTKFLDINNVKAGVHSSGALFYSGNEAGAYYEIPKGSGKRATYSEGLWIGGKDALDSVHFSAVRFTYQEFWPGPIIDINDTSTTETADQYDQIWKVDRKMIEEFKYMHSIGAVADGTYPVPFDLVSWPGDHPATGEMMAPYFDYNNDGMYDYLDGDYPVIRGDQMLWWVMNDFTPYHDLSGGEPLKVEIYASYYAYVYDNPTSDSLEHINNYSFIHYDLVNRSGVQYDSCYLAYISDFDLGYAWDDRVGSHVDLNSMYVYNGLAVDGIGQTYAYGGPAPSPPVFAVNFLRGPEADEMDGIDNDRDFEIDEDQEFNMMSKFKTFVCGSHPPFSPQMGNPRSLYGFISGKWSDGSNMMYGGNGHYAGGATNVECDYYMPGLSDPNGWGTGGQTMPEWSELTVGYPEHDAKGIASSGTFTFEVGETTSIDLAYIWTQHPDSISLEENLNYHFSLTEDVVDWFKNDNFPSNYEFEIDSTSSVKEYQEIEMKLYPNPTSNVLYVVSDNIDNSESYYQVLDMHGRVLKTAKQQAGQPSALQVGELAPGIYFVKLNSNGRSTFRKFIKN